MSKAGERLIESAEELLRFFRGGSHASLIIYTPDGKGGLVRHEVSSFEEYAKVWMGEAKRPTGEA